MPSPWRHLPRSTAARPVETVQSFRCLFSPARFAVTGAANCSARLHPRRDAVMFPMALTILRPTARQRRESGATRCGTSGTFRTRNRISITLFVFSSATQNTKGLWHAGGAPPKRRFLGRGERPDQPLARSVSHRIAPARPLAPARRGTDPPGDSQIKLNKSLPAPGGGEGVGVLAGPNFNPVGVVDLSPG